MRLTDESFVRLTFTALLTGLALPGHAATQAAPVPAPTAGRLAAAIPLPSSRAALAEARRVADWQLANRDRFDLMPRARPSVRNPLDWQQATFWVALTDLADRDRRYARPILDLGRASGWRLGDRPYHADDQLIAQVWEWASRHGGGPAALGPARRYFDHVLANRPTGGLMFGAHLPGGQAADCTARWCWCDALFMAPPTLLRLGKILGDPRYARFVDEEFAATTALLFDPAERLFFRDSRFIDQRDEAGRKLFWSRGNGWVLAGLARVLEAMPASAPGRQRYEALFISMAGRAAELQKSDGYWPASMLDQSAGTPPESSGTGFFVYALARGVRSGLLDRQRFTPVIARGWNALVRSVGPDGRVGWVQQVGDRPADVAADDSQFYGAGAVILAGVAISDL